MTRCVSLRNVTVNNNEKRMMKFGMIKIGVFCGLLGMIVGLTGCHSSEKMKERVVVPAPLEMKKADGTFTFQAATRIAVPGEEQRLVAQWFAGLFRTAAGFEPKVEVAGQGDVLLVLDSSLKEEAYKLDITSDLLQITASSNRGFFYALQTVRLLLPAGIEASNAVKEAWKVPAMTVRDEPRFAYRGFMLDVARYFMPKEDVMRLVDCMSMLKLNKLHLHLSDDNGWRLEIKKYPRLAEVGGYRVDRPGIPFPARHNATADEKATVGGFYTQEEMKEIISYAAERQVEVIPEIDIPAHSNAALAAYPEYACPVVKQFIGVLPGLGGKNAEIIFCAGNDRTFAFLQDVLDEVMALFPSKYIHLGGDEAAKANWKKCPLCQQRIRRERLENEEELQGYFMERMSAYVRSHGKEVMGWDELTNSRLPKDAIVFGWQGFGNAALKAAAQGHRFVMTPARVTYLIRYQGPQWFEPLTYFGNNLMKNLYEYEPVQTNWKPEYEPLLMGVQASMWTEFCHSTEEVYYMVFPRLAALAEIAWAPKKYRNWPAFLKGLDTFTEHLNQKGVTYARSMFNIQQTVRADSLGQLMVKLECERPDVEIRYTLDGSEPSASAICYEQPFVVKESLLVKAATFKDGQQMGKTLELPLKWNKATAKPLLDVTTGKQLKKGDLWLLVNGVRGSERQTDFEWTAPAIGEPLSFTVDLLQAETLNKCSLGSVSFYGMAVHKPRSLKVEVSEDNRTFSTMGILKLDDEKIFQEGRNMEQLGVVAEKPVRARYVRFTLEGAGLCPEGHIRAGQPARFYIDEVVIE